MAAEHGLRVHEVVLIRPAVSAHDEWEDSPAPLPGAVRNRRAAGVGPWVSLKATSASGSPRIWRRCSSARRPDWRRHLIRSDGTRFRHRRRYYAGSGGLAGSGRRPGGVLRPPHDRGTGPSSRRKFERSGRTTKLNAELAEHAEKPPGFSSAVSAVSAFRVFGCDVLL